MNHGIVDTQLSRTYKLRTGVSPHALYFTITGFPKPKAFFINSKEMESFQWILTSLTAFSRQMQLGGAVPLLIKDMAKTFEPKGDYIIDGSGGVHVNSVVHHLGLILEQHMAIIEEELKMQETNFLCVKRWMDTVGQDVPAGPSVPNIAVLELREELIKEESKEAIDEFKKLVAYMSDMRDPETGEVPELPITELLPLVKELGDILVVVYGALVALGVDGDKVMNIVMGNNFGKVEHGTFRDDGKLIVDAGTKLRLKKEVTKKLTELLSHGT